MEWVASTLHTTSEHGVSSITTADAHTSRLPVVDWTDARAGLNGLVRFAERRNLVSARVSSHFRHGLILIAFPQQQFLHERTSVWRYTYTACLVMHRKAIIFVVQGCMNVRLVNANMQFCIFITFRESLFCLAEQTLKTGSLTVRNGGQFRTKQFI